MTLRKTLKELRGKREEICDDAQDDLTEIVVNIVDASATDDYRTPVILQKTACTGCQWSISKIRT
ncbi:hypothetical protein [Lelliottia sp. CFBP8978]|uniref:hypothetical protein n=1 Tax=Lelliottia sp. CFBP8978 TaxID=3096522 RepID=UPI002A6AE754|nr:hypothetical protein [Lelliottia sp. CFBP8978]MDY1035381.1 hypothetical protein [Lelliottia sp. CFBP8978]